MYDEDSFCAKHGQTAAAEIARLTGQWPDYDIEAAENDVTAKLSASLSATVDEVDPDAIDAAMHELAARRGEQVWQVEQQVLALTAGNRDCQSMARGLTVLGAMGDRETVELSDVPTAKQQELAKKGWALPDGSFPIPDKAHVHSAAVLWASGHGKDPAAAKRHIIKMAKTHGVPLESLPGFGKGDEDENGKAAATRAALKRAGISDNGIIQLAAGQADDYTVALAAKVKPAAEGLSPADAWLASLPGSGRMASQRAETDAMFGTEHATGKEITSKTRARSGQTSTHGEVDRLPRDYKSLGFFGREEPQTASEVHPPKSLAARNAGEERELAGGRSQHRIER